MLSTFRRHSLVALLVFSAAAQSAAVESPLDPGATICLRPLELPLEGAAAEPRRAAFEQQLVSHLVAAGYRVPDPRSVSEIVDRVKTEVGGYFDPVSGAADEGRYRQYLARLGEALRDELGCNAQMSARVVPLRGEFQNGTVSWDGRTVSINSPARTILQVLVGQVEVGWVAVFSLWLEVQDLEGTVVAFRSAGIESPVRLGVTKARDLVPEDLWFTDREAIDTAIQSALGPGGEYLRLRGTPEGVDRERAREAAKEEEELRRIERLQQRRRPAIPPDDRRVPGQEG